METIEVAVEQLAGRRGTEGVIVLSKEGLIIRSTITDDGRKADLAHSLDEVVRAAAACVKALFGSVTGMGSGGAGMGSGGGSGGAGMGEVLSFIRIKASNRELLINVGWSLFPSFIL